MTQHILTQDSSVQHTTQHLTWQYNPPPYNTSHRTPIYLTQPILTVVRFPFPEKMHNEFISMEKQFNHQGKSTCGGYCQNGFHWISRLLLLLEFPNIISIISTISSLPSSCLIPPCPIPSFTLFYLVQLKRSFHTNSSSAHTKPSDSTLASSSYLFLYTYTHIPLIPSISSSPPLSPCVCVCGGPYEDLEPLPSFTWRRDSFHFCADSGPNILMDWAYPHTNTLIPTHIHTCTLWWIEQTKPTNTHTHMQTQIHSNTNIHEHTYMHTYKSTHWSMSWMKHQLRITHTYLHQFMNLSLNHPFHSSPSLSFADVQLYSATSLSLMVWSTVQQRR